MSFLCQFRAHTGFKNSQRPALIPQVLDNIFRNKSPKSEIKDCLTTKDATLKLQANFQFHTFPRTAGLTTLIHRALPCAALLLRRAWSPCSPWPDSSSYRSLSSPSASARRTCSWTILQVVPFTSHERSLRESRTREMSYSSSARNAQCHSMKSCLVNRDSSGGKRY